MRRGGASRLVRYVIEESIGEADLSAEQSQAGQDSWLSSAHAYPSGTSDTFPSPRQGPSRAFGIACFFMGPFPSLRSAADFRRVSKEGRSAARGAVVVRAAPSTSPQGTCIGLVVSRKVGGAVTRNLVRRRIKESLRERGELLRVAAVDLVVVARPSAARVGFHELGRDLDKALGVLGFAGVTGSIFACGVREREQQ